MTAPHAIITGGSSGIGLALARELVGKGFRVSLLARNRSRLEKARQSLGPERTRIFPVDVGDDAACHKAVQAAIRAFGPADWAIACAGIVEPGHFHELSAKSHEDQMRTNYLGSLNFARAVVPHFTPGHHGHLVFISSGAAFSGIYGYSAYAPSKFAVRALAEILSVELALRGIAVSLVMPADTDTPQLRAEVPLRPAITRKVAGQARVWQPEDVARRVVRLVSRNRFLITFGPHLHALAWLHSVIGTFFRQWQTGLARRSKEG